MEQNVQSIADTEEGWFIAEDGKKLYSKTWKTVEPPKARLVFVHGYSDHCNNHGQFFPTLASNGIEVRSWDQRGWGQSVANPKDKGRSGGTTQVMTDITAFIKAQLGLMPQVPLFIMGHSMGGGEVLTYAAVGPSDVREQIQGYLIEAPLIQVSPRTAPWKITEITGRMAGKLMPNMQMKNVVDETLLTHDNDVNNAYRDDPLCHATGTLAQLEGMLDRGNNLHNGKVVPKEDVRPEGKQGILIMCGGADDVVDPTAVKSFAERLAWTDKTYVQYDEWKHVLHRESLEGFEEMPKQVVDWILGRVPGESPGNLANTPSLNN